MKRHRAEGLLGMNRSDSALALLAVLSITFVAAAFVVQGPSPRDSRLVTASTSTASTTTTTRPRTDVTIAAVGDMVCAPGTPVTFETCRQQGVSDLIVNDDEIQYLLALGDLQYETGDLASFQTAYEPTFGRLRPITKPVVGNHEYRTANAAGYFAYFGGAAGVAGQGYYSFDINSSWHVVVLNGNCEEVSCASGAAQERWLRADLDANTRPCVIAAWHQPRFSSGTENGGDPSVIPFWNALQDHRAEIALAAHEHNYERFDPQLSDGTPSPTGIRQFVVGTGGRSIYRFGRNTVPERNSVVRLQIFGILKLTLDDGIYSWKFITESGFTLDEGAGTCH